MCHQTPCECTRDRPAARPLPSPKRAPLTVGCEQPLLTHPSPGTDALLLRPTGPPWEIAFQFLEGFHLDHLT